MGTRGTVKFFEDGKQLVSIYHQYDSYPSGVGMKIDQPKFPATPSLPNYSVIGTCSKCGGPVEVFSGPWGRNYSADALMRSLRRKAQSQLRQPNRDGVAMKDAPTGEKG